MLESLTHTFLELPEMNYFYNLSARVIIYYLINPQIGKKKPDSVFLLPNMLDLVSVPSRTDYFLSTEQSCSMITFLIDMISNIRIFH